MADAPELLPWALGVFIVVGGVIFPLSYALMRTRSLAITVRLSRD